MSEAKGAARQVTVAAPAKINLALHVAGQRDDGFHLLDSLVCFAEFGDVVRVEVGAPGLAISGPFAAKLDGPNLCTAAAGEHPLDIHLTKNLPVASGIGGGSADAAAVLRAVTQLGLTPTCTAEMLGADVAVCLAGQPARMRGIGELLDPVPALPQMAMLLVNPGAALSTPQVFGALRSRENSPLPLLPASWNVDGLLDWLSTTRNDLEAPAISIIPEISEALAALRASGAEFARMSGSGATCFGLYRSEAACGRAAEVIARPGWWVQPTRIATSQRGVDRSRAPA